MTSPLYSELPHELLLEVEPMRPASERGGADFIHVLLVNAQLVFCWGRERPVALPQASSYSQSNIRGSVEASSAQRHPVHLCGGGGVTHFGSSRWSPREIRLLESTPFRWCRWNATGWKPVKRDDGRFQNMSRKWQIGVFVSTVLMTQLDPTGSKRSQ